MRRAPRPWYVLAARHGAAVMSIPEPTVTDDTTLVARCREGDASAWVVLVRRYQRLVYAIVRRAGLDEQALADVFQTVFLRLLQHLPRIAEPARLQAWIVTTAKREAWLQRQRGERMVSMTVAEPDGADDEAWAIADSALGPEEAVAHWQQLAQVQRGLERSGRPLPAAAAGPVRKREHRLRRCGFAPGACRSEASARREPAAWPDCVD